MPTLIEQLSTGLSTDGLTSVLGTQAGQLGQIVSMVAGLADSPPTSVGDFATRLTALAVPNLPNGQAVSGALGSASTALPADFSAATGGAVAEIGRFTDLVTTQLVPLLSGAVAVAKAVESLGGATFRCPPQVAAGAPPPPPPPPPPPGQSAGSQRLAAATERSQQVATLLALLPAPLNAGSLIERLVLLASGSLPSSLVAPGLPMLDDVIGPVKTLATWSGLSAADLGTDLLGTLTTLRDRIRAAGPDRLAPVLTDAAALQTPLRVGQLDTFLTEYLTQGTAVAVALEGADPATAVLRAGDLDTAIQGFETLRATMAADFTSLVPAVAASLARVANDIMGQLLHLVVQLEPLDPGALLTGLTQATPASDEQLQEFLAILAPITNFLEDVAEKLDFSTIEGGVATVATEASDIADKVRGALANVAIDVRAAFAQVQDAVAGIGLDALGTEMRAAITQAGDALEAAITTAFAPLQQALATAIQAISDAVDALDFGAVTTALSDAVSQVTGILQDPAVTNAINEIRSALQEVTDTISTLSFSPVTDQVIALIEEMQKGLTALENTDLNDALKGMLDTAMSVLPPDLRPVTDPIIDDFGVRIDQGPVVLLEAVRAKPQEVLDKIKSFDPGSLVGDALGAPFQQAKAKIEGFRPSTLLTPLEQELDKQKARLKSQAAPSRALAPVGAAFDSLLAQLDRISPDAIIGPLEQTVEDAIRDAVDASPVDEIFAEINGVFATIQGVLDTITSIGGTVQQLATALTALQDPDTQVDTWRDTILSKIDTVPNGAALDAMLTEIRNAIDACRHADLLSQYDGGIAALLTDLTNLAAGSRLALMVALQQRLSPLVRALPAGPDRTAIEAVMARLDPLNPAHTGGLRAAADLATALATGRAALAALASDFADTLHGAGGGLTQLRDAAAAASGLRGVVAADVDAALVPVRHLLAMLGAAAVPVGGIAQALVDLETRLTTALANILTGPSSLQTISDSIQAVVDTLRNIDLGFLRESLQGVFQTIRGQIEALGPKPLMLTLDQEFGQVIDALSLASLLPQPEIDALDASVSDIATKLGALDPEKLISDAVGPAFEADVLPLVNALDITPVFDALITALRGLDEELKSELARVNTAYQALLASRPGGSGASAGVGL